MDVSVILKLVDRLSQPAKKARASLAGLQKTTTNITNATRGAQRATRGLTQQQFALGRAVVETRRRFMASLPAYEAAGRRIGAGIRLMGTGIRDAGVQATRMSRLGLRWGGRAAAASGLSVAGIVAMGRAYANTVDEQAKFARQTGFTIQRLRELDFVAGRQGVSASELSTSLDGLNRRMGELRTGRGSLNSFLKRADPKLLRGLKASKSPGEAFDLMIGALSRIEDPARRAALAQAAFGRSGMVMVRIAELGADGLADMSAEARRLMGVLGDLAGPEAEAYNDAWGDVGTTIIGLRDSIASKLLPVLTPLMLDLRDWIAANRELISTGVVDFIRNLGEGIKSTDWGGMVADVRATAEAVRWVVDAIGGWHWALLGLLALPFLPAMALFAKGAVKFAVGVGKVALITSRALAPLFRLPVIVAAARGLAGWLLRIGAALVSWPVAAVATGLYIVWRNLDRFRARLGQATDGFRRMGDGAARFARGVVAGDLRGALAGLGETALGVKDVTVAAIATVGELARGVLAEIDGLFGTDLTGRFDGLVNYLEGLNLFPIGRAVLTSFWEGLKSVGEDLLAWARGIGERIRAALTFNISLPQLPAFLGGGGDAGGAVAGAAIGGSINAPPRTAMDVINEIDQSRTLDQDVGVKVHAPVTVNAVTNASPEAIGAGVAAGVERGVRRGLGGLHDGGAAGSSFMGAP